MPHLVLETSPGALAQHEAEAILLGASASLALEPSVEAAAIKARWLEAKWANVPHAHLELRLMEGRSEDVLKQISDRLFGLLTQNAGGRGLILTLEICPLVRFTYRK